MLNHLSLPHPDRITTWISSIEANPRFLHEVFHTISKFPNENRDLHLIIDAMSIKKLIQWGRKRDRMWGYCDFGCIEVQSGEVEVTQALVFMCASLNGVWKLLIAYFFQDESSATLQGELIKTALILSHKARLRVHSFTCDGSSTNYASLRILGFNISYDPDHIKNELFYYQYDGTKKYFILLPMHVTQ